MIRFVFTAIILVYTQHFSADNLSFMNITPNLLLPFVIYISIFKKGTAALIFAFILGIVLDLNNPPCFGITTLLFVILAFLLTNIKSMINKGQILAYFSVILVTNIVFFLSSNFIIYLFRINQIFPITNILLLSVYNTILSLVIVLALYYINKLSIHFREF